MSAHDISRHLFQANNHYTGTRMQQGRVMLDSDHNEARMLDEEEQRRLAVDVVGPHGSPDKGFTVTDVTAGLGYDFRILAGTYYLGGYRHEIADVPPLTQKFRIQTDWLQLGRSDVATLHVPAVPSQPRHDFVYLLGWDQGVTAVEDAELHDPAIPVHDTGWRVRRMHRVLVQASSASNCKDAFQALVASLEVGGHTFDQANFELKSGGLMGSRHNPVTAGVDMCKPAVLQGLAGAEHQALRVQLIAPDRFIWGIDNASTLFRLTVTGTGANRTLTLTAPLRDHAHEPRIGEVIELLPWGALLSNGQYVADHPVTATVGGGVLARVTSPYDPSTRTVGVTVADFNKLNAMLTWLTARAGEDGYLFGRLWQPGDNSLDGPIGVGFAPNEIIRLRGTDYEVAFKTPGIVGDYWIVAARPSTPAPVVPWDLREGGPPHGPRRFYSPLAVIQWTLSGMTPVPTVSSCRRTFRPLTRLRGCCTVTVGDNKTSFGEFSTITAAINALPLGELGKVCILPGEYRERIEILSRNDVVIEGCGARTVLRTPTSNTTSSGLITITTANRIVLRDLTVEASGQIGIMSSGTTYLQIERVNVTTRRDPALAMPAAAPTAFPAGSSNAPLSTIACGPSTSNLTIRDCVLTMVGEPSAQPNVALWSANELLVERCAIRTTALAGSYSQAWGGLWLRAGTNCTLRDNRIEGGLGHGITLGGVTYWIALNLPVTWFNPVGGLVLTAGPDCPAAGGSLPLTAPPPGGGAVATVDPIGPTSVTIRGNHITGMGSSGISVLGFWPEPPGAADPYRMIGTHALTVADNVIEGNFRRPVVLPENIRALAAFGGIVLGAADDLKIHDNRIENNGIDHRHAVCGIYVLHGENIDIKGNSIRNNGPRVADGAFSGIRAGVALQLVGRLVDFTGGTTYTVEGDRLRPAARVRGNLVHQPAGRALQIYGYGAMLVEGNVLISEGLTGMPGSTAHCVEIRNVGQSPDVVLKNVLPAFSSFLGSPPLFYDPAVVTANLLDGRIVFTDNQVRFNPVLGASAQVFCVSRFQSYGDVGVIGNQFFTNFQSPTDTLPVDTIVNAWSTRTNHNRWQDPIGVIGQDPAVPDPIYQTTLSARTFAALNFTTLNQASRCIEASIQPLTPAVPNNEVELNQYYTEC
ncbi:right-handed parallel beta-helix repeat-containing protein [Nannocystis radixulma]|uniref:Right-handed parallel beta-helix repeat-containing protein n=1 Tax=Nannocystis radixulma TaxID=2995305 RepID=A0ABT5BHI8_9BACT|nr:right-handed parallel beta-helix repeat-containing protein [Nannocystis radixulma]MDC0672878.1 right-handed parallel beta-helix repeat-containing protein [Nannocystis radixulma]